MGVIIVLKVSNAIKQKLSICKKDIRKIAPETLRLWFTTENAREAKAVIRKYFDYFIKGLDVENVSDFTRGHLKRGIE